MPRLMPAPPLTLSLLAQRGERMHQGEQECEGEKGGEGRHKIATALLHCDHKMHVNHSSNGKSNNYSNSNKQEKKEREKKTEQINIL